MLMALMFVGSIDFIDSRKDSKITNLVIEDKCVVPVEKKRLTDWCYLEKMVNDNCGLNLQLGVACGQK